MDAALITELTLLKQRMAAIESQSPYAYASYMREQDYLRRLVDHIPDAEFRSGVYYNMFTELGFRKGDVVHRRVLIDFSKRESIRAIDDIIDGKMRAGG